MSLPDLERRLAALRRQAERPRQAGETLEQIASRYAVPPEPRESLRERTLAVVSLLAAGALTPEGLPPAGMENLRELAPALPERWAKVAGGPAAPTGP